MNIRKFMDAMRSTMKYHPQTPLTRIYDHWDTVRTDIYEQEWFVGQWKLKLFVSTCCCNLLSNKETEIIFVQRFRVKHQTRHCKIVI